jgi:CheY-like chemotaxis protein
MHGGEVRATSEGPGKGATFEVRLPLARSITRDWRTRGNEDVASEMPPPDLSGHAILVVDDDETTRDLMVTMLSQCGAQVVAVESVRSAMAEFDTRTPELIVADLGMPEEDGLSMIRRIRQRPAGAGRARARDCHLGLRTPRGSRGGAQCRVRRLPDEAGDAGRRPTRRRSLPGAPPQGYAGTPTRAARGAATDARRPKAMMAAPRASAALP